MSLVRNKNNVKVVRLTSYVIIILYDSDIVTSTSSNISAANVNKDKNEDISTNANINISVTGIHNDKNIGNSFDNTTISKIDGNTRKQLKINKFKLFIAIINCKKPYLSKKNPYYKFFLTFFYNSLTFSDLKNYNLFLIISNSFVDLA